MNDLKSYGTHRNTVEIPQLWDSTDILMTTISNVTNLHTSTNQFQNGCMTYWLTGLVSIELYCITQQKTNMFSIQ